MSISGQKQSLGLDYGLLIPFAVLVVMGLLFLASAGSVIGFQKFGDSYFFPKRQLFYGIIPGFLCLLFFTKVSYGFLKKISIPFFALAIILLILVLIPGLGSTLNTGARSWFSLGFFSFQPAEIGKLALILFLGFFMAKKAKERDLYSFVYGFLPVFGLGVIPLTLVILQPDVGTASIMFIILFGMLFLGNARMLHLSVLFFAGLAFLSFLILNAPYRLARFTTFLHPELDPSGVGYHINQAFLAIGSGGMFGLGLGHSRQKFFYLPEVHADSIFAIIAEEMGFFVSVLFICLMVAIGIRGLRIAKEAPDEFGRLVAGGVVLWFLGQAFVNIGAMLGLMPMTGVPLLFVSHGGTASIIAFCAIGILLNISRYSIKNKNSTI